MYYYYFRFRVLWTHLTLQCRGCMVSFFILWHPAGCWCCILFCSSGIIFTLQGPALARSYPATIHIPGGGQIWPCLVSFRTYSLSNPAVKYSDTIFTSFKVLFCPTPIRVSCDTWWDGPIPSSQNGTRLHSTIYMTGFCTHLYDFILGCVWSGQ